MSSQTACRNNRRFNVSTLALTASTSMISMPVSAQSPLPEIIVTASHRPEAIQDVPLNIAVIDEAQIELQGFDEISDLAAFIPGINVSDQGGRDGNRIVARGLNADPVQAPSGQDNGGGTIATYIGEVPYYVDLVLNDLQRVEVLLGPQGTLYGAGTLGGAIRYIPHKPSFDSSLLKIRSDAYIYDSGTGVSLDGGVTFNLPVSDSFALRGSLDVLSDNGYIDYPYIVADPGTSEPDPVDFNDPENDFRPINDANDENLVSGRLAARWAPTDTFDATLTYYFQNGDYGGRSASSFRTDTIPSGEYDYGSRVEEPSERDNSLLALEIIADLGFAELTSATGIGRVRESGQRDQTDLLISLDFSYELFPTFTAFTFDDEETDTLSQEVRLASKGNDRLNWMVGGFYNKNNYNAVALEFTPAFIESFNVPLPASGDLEFFSAGREELEEQAIFGEIGYDISDAWDVTVGGRFYDYDFKTAGTSSTPIFDYLFSTDELGGGADDFQPFTLSDIESQLSLTPNQSDNGVLFKVNTSFEFMEGSTAYATFSQGFRVGASNGGVACTDNAFDDASQAQCLFSAGQQFSDDPDDIVLLNEQDFKPDTTNNYEIGMKTNWLEGRLQLNGAVYHIEWDDPQVKAASINTGGTITVNAQTATSTGVELDGTWQVSDRFGMRGNFSISNAELSSDVPGLIQTIDPPGFSTTIEPGLDGDRLPGSPERQFSILGYYTQPLENGDSLNFNAAYSWQSDVLSFTGGSGGSFTLPSYGRANIALSYHADDWSVTGYADNVFNDFSETSAANTPLSNQVIAGANIRDFRTNILPPRTIGLRANYQFE